MYPKVLGDISFSCCFLDNVVVMSSQVHIITSSEYLTVTINTSSVTRRPGTWHNSDKFSTTRLSQAKPTEDGGMRSALTTWTTTVKFYMQCGILVTISWLLQPQTIYTCSMNNSTIANTLSRVHYTRQVFVNYYYFYVLIIRVA